MDSVLLDAVLHWGSHSPGRLAMGGSPPCGESDALRTCCAIGVSCGQEGLDPAFTEHHPEEGIVCQQRFQPGCVLNLQGTRDLVGEAREGF